VDDVILHGDVYACLESITKPIAVAITSPPYWNQRDYGFEGQIGQEKTPEEYVGRLIAVYNKLRQKLREDGIFFLNVGDKYLSQYGKSHLLQIPYCLAYHMVKDGWRLEDIIMWFKPNHMPASVDDRFGNTYEPVLVLAKNEKNLYRKDLPNVVKVALQQTRWKHTAVFPEGLVKEMLNRVDLNDEDVVVDPFAGTGTVAVVVKEMRHRLFPKHVHSIMIEKGPEFVDIIRERTGITEVKEVNEATYSWRPVEEERLPELVPVEIVQDKNGEVFIAKESQEFLSALRGLATDEFRTFHREDAPYFFGVKKWMLEDLYYSSQIFREGYVLRNMLVVSEKERWYPVFFFARDSTIVAYKFYIDRIRIRAKAREKDRVWSKENFLGMKVSDISRTGSKNGYIVRILRRYPDSFPEILVVQWDGYASLEFGLHVENDESTMESLTFKCPKCRTVLTEPYDPSGQNVCPSCDLPIWDSSGLLPLIEEPKQIIDVFEELRNGSYSIGRVEKIEQFLGRKVTTSKFADLERVNWGASPGARKVMLGDYFTKMRLYRVDQPTVAQYLTILRRSRGLSVQDIVNMLPGTYHHTVGHWFRKDFGGSIPIPEDVELLKRIFGEDKLLKALDKTALKFQTIMASAKGRNPGDFIECKDEKELMAYLKRLYLPSSQYLQTES
jgi:site-specific DNA-methyltransferase (cytosine-N4-specific)